MTGRQLLVATSCQSSFRPKETMPEIRPARREIEMGRSVGECVNEGLDGYPSEYYVSGTIGWKDG